MPTSPPVAPKRPHSITTHGVTREDPYAWMQDREDPAVRAYLDAENAYTDAQVEPTAQLRKALYEEMLARIDESDQSVPVRQDDWLYYTRMVKGQDYPLHCRRHCPKGRPEADAGPEQVYLDENALAEDQEFFALGDLDIRKAHDLAAYTVDLSGDERYTLFVRDLSTGTLHGTTIEDVADEVLWAMDGTSLLYLRLDDAHRPFQVWRHELGSDPESDQLVFEELDEAFYVGIRLTRSERFIVIGSHSQVTSEEHLLDAKAPGGPLRVVAPRRQDVEYTVEHRREHLLVLTNHEAPTFAVRRAPIDAPATWEPFIDVREDVTIEDVEAFDDWIVVSQRRDALREIVVHEVESGEHHVIEMPDPVYAAWVGANPDPATAVLRLGYTSLGVPHSVFDYDLRTRARTLRKQQRVFGFDPDTVVTERLWVEAADGASIPVSLVRRRADVGKSIPVWMYGYGSYGANSSPTFSTTRVSLLERGIGVAIAHVRGGAIKGRTWYEDGKLLRKKNTFTDFIAVAEALKARGIASSLAMYGGSAGGLLVGAVANERPDLFEVAIADVPFVDVLNTMLDESLPLTVVEWEEWGNPNEPETFEYMASYAPYENVAAQDYPAMLLLAGWTDPRVSYWEPAKFTARLREHNTGSRPILLRTHFEAGHGGPSGRYAAYEETAFIYAFALEQLGVHSAQQSPTDS
ncbi:MAG: S9 family peptidase [Nannocystaceae bacterium]|nr:S9 family peptidase [bacterium]